MTQEEQSNIMTVAEVSRYLKLSEKTLLKMVRNREIPCTKIGNQWRFMKEVLDDWLVTRMTSESSANLSQLGSTEYEVILLSRLLDSSLILMDMQETDKEALLHRFGELAGREGVVTDGEELFRRLVERESLASTALGSGIALPHPRRPDPSLVKTPRLLVGVSEEGVEFNAFDGGKTHLIFVILATNDALHLRVMARLSSFLRDEKLVRGLRQSRDSDDLVRKIVEKERREIGGSGKEG